MIADSIKGEIKTLKSDYAAYQGWHTHTDTQAHTHTQTRTMGGERGKVKTQNGSVGQPKDLVWLVCGKPWRETCTMAGNIRTTTIKGRDAAVHLHTAADWTVTFRVICDILCTWQKGNQATSGSGVVKQGGSWQIAGGGGGWGVESLSKCHRYCQLHKVTDEFGARGTGIFYSLGESSEYLLH